MPALKPTDFYGKLVYLGHVADRKAKLASDPLLEIAATFQGYEEESHAGLTRPSDSRVLAQYERGHQSETRVSLASSHLRNLR
jgi:hypothetical protein